MPDTRLTCDLDSEVETKQNHGEEGDVSVPTV